MDALVGFFLRMYDIKAVGQFINEYQSMFVNLLTELHLYNFFQNNLWIAKILAIYGALGLSQVFVISRILNISPIYLGGVYLSLIIDAGSVCWIFCSDKTLLLLFGIPVLLGILSTIFYKCNKHTEDYLKESIKKCL